MPCWYYDKRALEDTPSMKDNIPAETEARYRREGAQFIIDIGNSMGLSHDTWAAGVVYFHRFYMFYSFREYNRYVMAACCLFLAGKVEETPKKCKDLMKKVRESLTETQFAAFGEDAREEVITLERILLQTIKFDLQVRNPYTYLMKYAKLFKGKGDQEKLKKMVQTAWTFMNDSLCTTLCLQWEPEIIAVALMYLSSRLSKLEITDWIGRPPGFRGKWWEYLAEDANMDLLEEICHKVLDLYPTKKAGSPPPPPPPKQSPRESSKEPPAKRHKSNDGAKPSKSKPPEPSPSKRVEARGDRSAGQPADPAAHHTQDTRQPSRETSPHARKSSRDRSHDKSGSAHPPAPPMPALHAMPVKMVPAKVAYGEFPSSQGYQQTSGSFPVLQGVQQQQQQQQSHPQQQYQQGSYAQASAPTAGYQSSQPYYNQGSYQQSAPAAGGYSQPAPQAAPPPPQGGYSGGGYQGNQGYHNQGQGQGYVSNQQYGGYSMQEGGQGMQSAQGGGYYQSQGTQERSYANVVAHSGGGHSGGGHSGGGHSGGMYPQHRGRSHHQQMPPHRR